MFPPCPVSPDPTSRSMSPPVPLVPRVGLLWIRIGIVAELCITIAPDSFTCRRLSASSYPCLIRMGVALRYPTWLRASSPPTFRPPMVIRVASQGPISSHCWVPPCPASSVRVLVGSPATSSESSPVILGTRISSWIIWSCSVLICTRSVYVSWYTMLLVDTKLPWTVRSPNTSVRTVFDPLRPMRTNEALVGAMRIRPSLVESPVPLSPASMMTSPPLPNSEYPP